MFNTVHTNSKSLCLNSASSTFPECSSEVMNEQSLSFTTTDLNIVEMTEIEYTQLQQILCSHMDPQNSEDDRESRVNSSFFPAPNCSNLPPYQPSNITNQTNFTACNSGGQNVHPVIAVASDSSAMSTNQTLGHIDFQELKLMMLSESNMPLTSNNTLEKITNKNGGDASVANTLRVRQVDNIPGLNKENENLAVVSESRAKSAVRVRLEDRFNSIQAEVPRCQELQEAGVTLNNVVTMIRHPSQLVGAQQHNKCATLVKNKSSASTASIQFKYPAISLKNTVPSGNAATSQTQEMESTNQTLEAQNKSLSEQVWIKMGAMNKRSRSRVRQVDGNIDRRALSDIQKVEETKPSEAPGVSWPPAKIDTTEQVSSNKQGCSSQRREKHNRMERDRRRRIRVCCDELNHLVPFCNVETDKATTLQWTTAFLKYIHERDGDSLKKEFESVFCGKTGRRLKAARSEGLRTVQAQAAVQNHLLQDAK